jgi:hypothetical protein
MNIEYPTEAFDQNHRRALPEPPYLDGRTVSASHLTQWFASGLRGARVQPLLWLALMAACAAVITVLKIEVMLRPLVVLIFPLFAGALMYAQDRLRNGRPAGLGEVIAAVRAKSNALLAVGLLSGAVVAIGYMIMFAALNASLLASVMTTGFHNISISYGGDAGARGVLESMVGVPIFTIAIASAWFAPALVMLHDVPPLEAMMASLNGAARNWSAAAFFLVAMAGAVLIDATVPLLTSALVLTPLMLLSLYDGYRDVFVKR